MKNWLISPLKKRVIREIRQILYEHPKYRADSENVQNKFSFDNRPQRGVTVTNASADRIRLSADNYIGCISSFVMQAPIENYPNTSLDWVTENSSLLERYSPTRNIFPSPPGVYILSIDSLPDISKNIPGQFYIDPILNVTNERLIVFRSSVDQSAQLSHDNLYHQAVRLYLDGKTPLVPGVDYQVNYQTGEVNFLKNTPAGSAIYADYRYVLDRQGPFNFMPETTNYEAIPGAILAFGDRAQVCDKLAIVVNETRTDTAKAYGGKFEVSFSLKVFVRGDAEDREKLSDYIIIKFLERQDKLGYEGIELIDISPGGESEEVYSEATDDYYYDSDVALSLKIDWEIYQPLPVSILRVVPTSQAEEQSKGYLDGSYTEDLLQAVTNPVLLDGLILNIGNKLSFERIR